MIEERRAFDRRIYDAEERKLIEAGRPSEAKVRWTKRYHSTPRAQRLAMWTQE